MAMGLVINEAVVLRAVFHGAVDAHQIRYWLDRVQALIDAHRPFYFVASTAPGATFCDDYRALQAVWYKQYKAAFRQYCRGLVRIASDAAEQQRLDTPALHAAWAVPYFVTADAGAGMRWIGEHLEQADAH
ncbi:MULTISPECIES: hypothetical protein [Stenotrophomonas]|jgi:hypothetical protein|nr:MULTISPECIES: hypothetical protein [Stenotrophomonas]MDG2508568.1 hypothetical protein [Stenotrophomonas maltophilia]MDH0552634.1 hypothetical protein [Stenotrophomonas sp. GD04006]WQI21150.1 hypothetical protein U2S91_00455 [Stenotrophomonas maltophilia]